MSLKIRFGALTAPVLMALVLVAFFCPPAFGDEPYDLTLIKLPENKAVLVLPVNINDRIYMDYVHSLDKTPVRDVFAVGRNGVLILLEERYEWYGAGLAFHPEGKGRILLEKDGARVLINRPCHPFYLRVGRIANHTLTVNSRQIPLLEVANGGDLLAMAIEKRPSKEPPP